MPAEKKNKGGAPSLYKPEYAEQAYKLCLLGSTDAEMANFFNVTETTVNNWKLAHPEFFESIKRGKEIADAEMAESLFNRGKGYSHPETKVFVYDGSIITETITKHYPPDTAAAIIWLKNRQPAKWREKQPDEEANKDGVKIIIQREGSNSNAADAS